MADFNVVTINDQAVVAGGESRDIHFRPLRPGNVTVRSFPAQTHVHSETGYLGQVDLYRPGAAKPLRTVKAKVPASAQQPVVLGVSYPATDADLAPAGDWTCVVRNWADADIRFDTAISYLGNVALEHRTASFDVELLNLILAEAIADSGLSWHLQSSPEASDQESSVSWSAAAAATLPGDLRGLTSSSFYVPDLRLDSSFGLGTFTWIVFRLLDLDSAPTAPVMAFLTADNGVPMLEVDVSFNTQNAKLVAVDSDADLDKLDVVVSLDSFRIRLQGRFDGSISATTDTAATFRSAGLNIADVSSLVNGNVQDKIDAYVHLDPGLARGYLDQFFVLLMRLGAQATIQDYQIVGDALVVDYTAPLLPPVTGGHVGGAKQVGVAKQVAKQ